MGKMRTVEVKVTAWFGRPVLLVTLSAKVGRILMGSLRVSRVAHRGYRRRRGTCPCAMGREARKKTGAL